MLCNVCREGLEGIWDPDRTKRLGKLEDFSEIIDIQFQDPEEIDNVTLLEVENYVFGHHTSYDSLLRSKRQGCVACNTFGESNDADDLNLTFAAFGYYSVFCIGLERKDLYPRPLMLIYTGDPIEEIPIEMIPHDTKDFMNSALSTSTASPETWTLVQNWLNECLSKHEACHARFMRLGPKDGSLFCPTRLLELQTPPPLPIPPHLRSNKWPELTSTYFRLVDNTQYPANVKYVTLSHCWGPGPAHEKLRLIKSTESKLRKGMPVSDLPRTFRDAFEIVSRLGVRYLWIDRLCIVQDSAADWAAEAGTMKGVYRGGFLNIAALGAADDEFGCFVERDPKIVGPGLVNLRPKDRLPMYYRHPDEATKGWKTAFSSGPLIGRAWVLQERLLATRNLYFGRSQVFWECCSNTCCETLPTGPLVKTHALAKDTEAGSKYSKVMEGLYSAWKSLIDVENTAGGPSSDPLVSLMGEWSKTVNIYSSCHLSFTDDKLIAVSGLAEDMRSKLKVLNPDYGDYIAGMWRVSLPRCLMWTVMGPSERPTPYRAPSWSWASVKGVISFPKINTGDCLVSVDTVEIINKGDGVTGQVIGGLITLRGPLCISRGARRSRTSSSLYNRHIARQLHHLDTDELLDLPFNSIDIHFDASDDQYDEVTLLLFWSWSSPMPVMDTIHGLALVRSGGSRSSYLRVGCVKITVYFDEEDERDDCVSRFLKDCSVQTIEVV
ncbi:HET-domain-containing protein [Camillea tinctor]|nr:HET-domain-containing protein [Camillea tinctor]